MSMSISHYVTRKLILFSCHKPKYTEDYGFENNVIRFFALAFEGHIFHERTSRTSLGLGRGASWLLSLTHDTAADEWRSPVRSTLYRLFIVFW